MPLRTVQQYVESLRDDRTVFFRGERVPDVTRHPVISRGRRARVDRLRDGRGPGAPGSCRRSRRRRRILPLLRHCPQRRRPPQAQRADREGDGGRGDAGGADQGDRHRCVVRADARGVRDRCPPRHRLRRAASRPSTGTAGRTISRWRSRRPTSKAIGRSGRRPRPIPTCTCASSSGVPTASSSAAPRRIPRSAPTPTSSSCCRPARWPRRIATTR